MSGMYADEGISGTNIKNKMTEDCKTGKTEYAQNFIDKII